MKLKGIALESDTSITPRVFLFSGHMLDAPDRQEERFSERMTEAASDRISSLLDELGASEKDTGLCGGACGGDLLFASTCLERGMNLEIHIPFLESDFLDVSVNFAGPKWTNLYHQVKSNPRTRIHEMPIEYVETPQGVSNFEWNNQWLVNSALSCGSKPVHFIFLWNGASGDGRGGTEGMYNLVRQFTDAVSVIDTKTLLR